MSLVSFTRWRHPLMRRADTIKVIGYNGDECTLAGPGMGDWGPILAPHSTGLLSPAPFKTNWSKSALGQRFESWSPQRRDVAWTIHILNPETGNECDPQNMRDADLWHLIYSRWCAMFHPEYESTVVYNSVDGERRLGIRQVKEAQPFVGAEFEGGDPHLITYGSVGMLMGCENPYYIGETEKFVYEWEGAGSHWFPMPYYNPASVMCWPKWSLTDRAQWTLPDYSFGWEEYGTGIADLGKTVRLPLLRLGENIDVDSDPSEETIIAENEAPVYERMAGRDLEYPILSGMGDPENGCVVRVSNVTNPDGARCELFMPRWHNEPFGTPRVVGATVGIGAA